MRKTIFSIPELTRVMYGCNRQYIEFLCAVDDPTNGIKKINKIISPIIINGRSFRGFNLFSEDDEIVLRAISQGDTQGFGIRNITMRKTVNKNTGQVSRIIKRLCTHGIIKKAPKSYKYYLTSLGRQITATSLKLKEMYVTPVLRSELVIS